MDVKIPKTLMEPGTIPWETIRNEEDRQVDILLHELMGEVVNHDMDELMHQLAARIAENAKRLEKDR